LLDDGYASKARPAVIVQGRAGDIFDSVILCLLTTYGSDGIATRVRIEPSPTNGLQATSYAMTDKLVTASREELGVRVGRLTDSQMHDLSRQIAFMLDIASEDTL